MRQIPFSDLVLETTKRGRTGANAEIETAQEQARWILRNHEPEPPDEAVQAELERLLAAADREIRSQ
jgi:trimethylamine:corrinoid methyltransferase-like protein